MNYNAGDYYVYKGKLCPPEVTLGCFRVIWHKLFVLTVNAIHARAAEIRSYKLGITVGGINYFMSGEFLLVSDSKQTGCVAGF